MKRIFLKISDTRLECQDEHPSLLAALESHNIDVEYQCRAGCGSCRTRLVSGQVDWLTEPLAFIQPGDFALLLPGERRYRNRDVVLSVALRLPDLPNRSS
jgi:ferredoxin